MATIKIPSPAPTGGYNTSFAGRPRRAAMNIDMDEEDAEGEEDLDDEIEGIGEDTTPYCFCQKPSFGEVCNVFPSYILVTEDHFPPR